MKTETTTTQLLAVLSDLTDLLGSTHCDDMAETPCENFNFTELQMHVVGWVQAFTDGLTSAEGRCSDPDDLVIMGDGAAQVQACAARLAEALPTIADDRLLYIGEAGLPTSMALSMMLWEYQMHGWDLAAAAGLPWSPPEDGVLASLQFAPAMLTEEYQGKGKAFGPRLESSPEASPFERLLALSGRDPGWQSQASREGAARAASAPKPTQQASGTFTVEEFTAHPHTATVSTGLPTGIALMRKEFAGEIAGTAQTIFVAAFDQAAGRGSYVAMESFEGSVNGHTGAFNFTHAATTLGGPERVDQYLVIVPFSGTDELAGITGSGRIEITTDGTHHLHLDYRL